MSLKFLASSSSGNQEKNTQVQRYSTSANLAAKKPIIRFCMLHNWQTIVGISLQT